MSRTVRPQERDLIQEDQFGNSQTEFSTQVRNRQSILLPISYRSTSSCWAEKPAWLVTACSFSNSSQCQSFVYRLCYCWTYCQFIRLSLPTGNVAAKLIPFVLYCIVLYCIVLYCIVLYCIVLYCIVLYCIVLYCIVLLYALRLCSSDIKNCAVCHRLEKGIDPLKRSEPTYPVSPKPVCF